ncbi:phosphoribosylformylglycinamidine cyclo-ligase [archaeon SCG-AAA382B04]|nr:phosphoribosylformylglycinamidine cyclo-ligase [archaeon SCG-AAA382B04]
MDYEKAGVDLDKEEKTISALAKQAVYSRKDDKKKIDTGGHFAGLMSLKNKQLAISTDGVGTKLLVANKMEEYESIGIDCVAMNVNDVLSVGAEPLAFVDYLAFEDPKPEISAQLGKGIKKGAERANVNVLGGETATLTEIINNFDIAGTCVGIADEAMLGKNITEGDKIIGIKSNGIHSNGLTLARESIKNAGYNYHDKFNQNNLIGEELLKPTRIYVKSILGLIEDFNIKGLAHITGGGLTNLTRLGDYQYLINNPLEPPEIFDFIKKCGEIDQKEMYNIFNMGIGYSLITEEKDSNEIIEKINDFGFRAEVIGEIRQGSGVKIEKNQRTLKFG